MDVFCLRNGAKERRVKIGPRLLTSSAYTSISKGYDNNRGLAFRSIWACLRRLAYSACKILLFELIVDSTVLGVLFELLIDGCEIIVLPTTCHMKEKQTIYISYGAINFVSRILVVCMGKRYDYHQFCILTEPNLVSILYLMSQQGSSLADYQLTDPLRHSGGPREVSLLLLLHSFTHRPSHSWGNFCSGVKITIDGFKFQGADIEIVQRGILQFAVCISSIYTRKYVNSAATSSVYTSRQYQTFLFLYK